MNTLLKPSVLTSCERVKLTLAHKETDRIPCADIFWNETIDAWKQEGMPFEGRWEVAEHFNFDISLMTFPWTLYQAKPGYEEIVSENEEFKTFKNSDGTVFRVFKNKSAVPEHVAFTVDGPDKWNDLKKTFLALPKEQRISLETTLKNMQDARKKNRWFSFLGYECIEVAKNIVGHEGLCIGMAEDPDWINDMLGFITDICIEMQNGYERGGVTFDGGFIYGDVAYNKGPFFSPRMYRELVMPHHKRLFSWFKDRGLPVIYHTDGDFRSLIPSLLEAGVDCFQPLEAKAGIDVRELKHKHGAQVSFMGNIDATILLTNDLQKIEDEIAAKIPIAKQGGGYIYHSDHSVPPGVTWETYKSVMELVKKYGSYS